MVPMIRRGRCNSHCNSHCNSQGSWVLQLSPLLRLTSAQALCLPLLLTSLLGFLEVLDQLRSIHVVLWHPLVVFRRPSRPLNQVVDLAFNHLFISDFLDLVLIRVIFELWYWHRLLPVPGVVFFE